MSDSWNPTGTTASTILAQGPDTRSPLNWETMFPSPPPQRETVGTPRIALAASFLPDPENETESEQQFRAMHPRGAELTQECVTMMGGSMCTPLLHNQTPATAGCSRRAPTCGASTACCAPTRTQGSCSPTATR